MNIVFDVLSYPRDGIDVTVCRGREMLRHVGPWFSRVWLRIKNLVSLNSCRCGHACKLNFECFLVILNMELIKVKLWLITYNSVQTLYKARSTE